VRKRLLAAITALIAAVVVPAAVVEAPATASPGDEYSGTHFGANNFPPGCVRDRDPANPDNVCYHQLTGLNALDSPQVDVLVMVPVSATAERDMRIMRQSVEMWEAGIDYMAGQMDLEWLADGVDFHVTVDTFDPTGGDGGDGGEFTTYPIVDPEIVVIASNPVGGIGIGIDPVATANELDDVMFDFMTEDAAPCHSVANPFDFAYWENLPGFERHHEARSGTYTEDCGGAGGNICFAINGAIDPVPDRLDFFGMFDLVSHEFGHCLTLGHVGDGADGPWGPVPTNDIMAYSSDPAGGTKCVSSLDVESFAVRMSSYLDTNADGALSDADRLLANDQELDLLGHAYHVQHPSDHFYASSTGSPLDCPQPDLGLVPGERTEWTPAPVATSAPELIVTSPADGATSKTGAFTVSGTAGRRSLAPTATATSGAVDDAPDDASTPATEIERFAVAVTPTHIDATMTVAQLAPNQGVPNGIAYGVVVNTRRFDSLIPPTGGDPVTWDAGAERYLDAGTSTWDADANTVTFRLPLDYLAGEGLYGPFLLRSEASYGLVNDFFIAQAGSSVARDDHAPDTGALRLAGPEAPHTEPAPASAPCSSATHTFEHEGGNTFAIQDASFIQSLAGMDASHSFTFDVPTASDVAFTLDWGGFIGGSDLDLYVTANDTTNEDGASAAQPERVTVENVSGTVNARVSPLLVTEPEGLTYTLSAVITPAGCDNPAAGDLDGDGVPNGSDACPKVPGTTADGCAAPSEFVRVAVDGRVVASQAVFTRDGPVPFSVAVEVPPGAHTLRVEWEARGETIASETISVARPGRKPRQNN
jgi:hypothetical protein